LVVLDEGHKLSFEFGSPAEEFLRVWKRFQPPGSPACREPRRITSKG
jgi:hypothetical protein